MPKTVEQRLMALEETVKLLYSAVIEGKPYIPGQAELDRAIEAARNGDAGPLGRYMVAGGIIPDVPDHRRGGRRQKSALCGRGGEHEKGE